MEGVVTHVDNSVTQLWDYCVHFPGWTGGHFGECDDADVTNGHWYIDDHALEPAAATTRKFKVGDKVKCVNREEAPFGLEGVIANIIRDGYCVQFPGWTEGHDGEEADGNICDRWYLGEGELEPVAATTPPTVASDLKVTPQARKVLQYLRDYGDITPMKALIVLGIPRLASCVHELRRKAGYKIKTEVRNDAAGHRYGVYVLES